MYTKLINLYAADGRKERDMCAAAAPRHATATKQIAAAEARTTTKQIICAAAVVVVVAVAVAKMATSGRQAVKTQVKR